jgi:methylase of polypeptide subunit release factors
VLVERLIAEATSRLVSGGLLALEIGHDQAERVMALLAANNYRDIAAHRDYQGIQRFVSARHG